MGYFLSGSPRVDSGIAGPKKGEEPSGANCTPPDSNPFNARRV
jgi:hypothetical protein